MARCCLLSALLLFGLLPDARAEIQITKLGDSVVDAESRGMFSLEGKLIIAAATADSRWKDWRIIHTEKGPFFNEMLGDAYRWKGQEVLSIMVQQSPKHVHEPTALRILDFSLKANERIR